MLVKTKLVGLRRGALPYKFFPALMLLSYTLPCLADTYYFCINILRVAEKSPAVSV